MPEPYFTDASGAKQDAALWDEILGDDDLGTWDPSVDPEPGDPDSPEPTSKLAALRDLLSELFE